jgi:hypothetical protein
MKRTVYFYLIAALMLSTGGLNAQEQEKVEDPKLIPGYYFLDANLNEEDEEKDTTSFTRVLVVHENSVGRTDFFSLEPRGKGNTDSCSGTINVYEKETSPTEPDLYVVKIETDCKADPRTEYDDIRYEEALFVEKTQFEKWMLKSEKTGEMSGKFLRLEGSVYDGSQEQEGTASLKLIRLLDKEGATDQDSDSHSDPHSDPEKR